MSEELKSERIIKKFEDVKLEMLSRLIGICMSDDLDLQKLEDFIREGQEQRELASHFFKGAAKVYKSAKESGFLDEE